MRQVNMPRKRADGVFWLDLSLDSGFLYFSIATHIGSYEFMTFATYSISLIYVQNYCYHIKGVYPTHPLEWSPYPLSATSPIDQSFGKPQIDDLLAENSSCQTIH